MMHILHEGKEARLGGVVRVAQGSRHGAAQVGGETLDRGLTQQLAE